MKISAIIFGLIIFSGLTVGISLWYVDLATTYGKTDITDISYLNRTAQTAGFYQGVRTNLTSSQGLLERVFTTPGIIWGSIVTMMDLPNLFVGSGGVVNQTSTATGLPIPDWFIVMVTGLIISGVTFLIVGFFTGREV